MAKKRFSADEVIGSKYGKLTAISECSGYKKKDGYFMRKFLCVCDCGNEKEILANSLRTGASKSCGCERIKSSRESVMKHGMSGTRPYRIWRNMISRCTVEKYDSYKWYGGKGITVCERWKDFESFWEDMGAGYNDKLTIDRINNNGNYDPNNCRWATQKEQANNTSRNRFIEFNGERRTLTQWAEKMDVSAKMLDSRLRRGWSVKKALNLIFQ